MALLPKGQIKLGSPQTIIYFGDITGLYNVTTNPGGYGAPNPEKSDVGSTKLYLTPPGSETEVLITPWTYLPTDAADAEITCEMFTAPTDVEAEDECADCPDSILNTDCDPEEVTCFIDGCWSVHYQTFNDALTLIAETTFNQFFYGQTLKRLNDMTLAVKKGMVPAYPEWNWEDKLSDAWLDYHSMILNAQLNDCDCVCSSNALASVQKKLTEMENKV